MFISRQEKESILFAIKKLQEDVFKLSLALTEVRPPDKKSSRRMRTEEEKKRASERMKKFWADKKNGASK